MSVSKEQILESIAQMSVMDVVDLVAMMEEKFGVSAAAAVAATVPSGSAATPAVEEKTEFNVVMTKFGDNKVSVIKIVREKTGLGLKEAKDLVEAVPSIIKESIGKGDAEALKKQLEEAGAVVEIK